MTDFDAHRRVYCRHLAAALLHSDWSAHSLRREARKAVGPRRRWLKPLLERVQSAFATVPRDRELIAFLLADAHFETAWQSHSERHGERLQMEMEFDFPLRMQMPTVPLIRDMPMLETPGKLAGWLGIPTRRLNWYADLKGLNDRAEENLQHYRRHWLPKRAANRFRLLEEPKPILKSIQRQILSDILDCLRPHPAAHGFCRDRSIATNAAEHCGRAIVIRFDLQDFFPSIPAPRVAAIFEALGFPQVISLLFAGLCTTRLPYRVWNVRPGSQESQDHTTWLRLAVPHLPQGAPTSPTPANLCAYRLDCRLSALARDLDAAYTRYADDLTFSGNGDLAPHRLQRCVTAICAEEGFALNPHKTRIQRQSSRQCVAGVIVNLRPNLPRSDYDTLKAILTNCVRHGPATQNRDHHADYRSHLTGRISFFAMIHPARGRKLWRIFDRISWK